MKFYSFTITSHPARRFDESGLFEKPRAWLVPAILIGLLLTLALFSGCRGASSQAAPVPVLPGATQAREASPQESVGTRGQWPRTFTDALGEQLRLDRPARRVVSVAPNLTEIVYFVGAGDRLVGRTDFCHYPPEARQKPSIGGVVTPSLEKVLAQQPDLVLVARGTDLYFIQRLRQQGLPVYGADPKSLEDVFDLIVTIGQMLGCEETARARVAELRRRVETIRRRLPASGPRPRALALLSLDPLFVAGGGSFLDDLLRLAGLDNVAAKDKPWAQWGSERLLAANPDVIIRVSGPREVSSTGDGLAGEPWRSLRAVQEKHVYAVPEDLVTIPGPRLVEGLEKLVQIRLRLTGREAGQARSPRAEEKRPERKRPGG